MRSRPLIPLFVLIALGAGVRCRDERSPERVTPARAIVLISIDTLRSDRLPAYGYGGVSTPFIDAFRADAVLFGRAYAHIPLTLPSHATMFTGVLPADTGLRDNAGFRLASDRPTIAEILKGRGYATGAAVSSFSLRRESGIARGFDLWDDRMSPASATQVMGEVQRGGEETIRVAKEWIRARKDQPFFFFLHLYEPHTPYEPPEPYRSRYASAYDGEIAYSDALVGDFLDFLRQQKIYGEALVILVSDHGEGLNDHGEDEHGILLYREAIQVPLLVKLPRAKEKGRTIDTPAQLIDLFPTIRDFAGAPRDEIPSRAESLVDIIAGRVSAARPVFSETYFPRLHLGWSELHSLIRDDRHLIDGPQPELYNPVGDPVEKHEISAVDRRARALLLDEMKQYIRDANPTANIDPAEAAKLQALGYLGSAATDGGALPDPKQVIGKFREVRQALWLHQNRRFADAVAATDSLLHTNARMYDVWDIRARSLAELGRNEEARSAARRAANLFPSSSSLMLLIAELSLRTGNYEDAANHARLALAEKPAEGHDILSRAALSRGDLATAEAEARAAHSANPESPSVEWTLGRIAAARKRNAEALGHFDRAAELIRRGNLPALRNLQQDRGFVLAILGRTGEAEAALSDELRNFPQDSTAWPNLLMLYRQQGRIRDMERLIDQWTRLAPGPATYAQIRDVFRSMGDSARAQEWAARAARPAGASAATQ